jgi:hypothetical protein
MLGSFLGSLLGYELARRVNVLRFMVGLKMIKRSPRLPSPEGARSRA